MTALSDSERLAWLRLIRSENVGPSTFMRLIAHYRSAEKALERLPELARRGGRSRPITIAPEDDVRRELDAVRAVGGRMIAVSEPDYPPGLKVLDPAPPMICVLGNVEALQREAIAIVGARNASAAGLRFAQTLAQELSAAGFLVVSGLARGIDAAAHRGSLASGTCAVMAGGADVIYPPEHAELHDKIQAHGAAISEMPLGFQPLANHFPRRNRLISGMSRGVVVVEAATGSGSLITARYALEQGREVFAVPGSPLDPRAQGTNNLLRQGAVMVESAADILNVLQPILGRAFEQEGANDAEVFAPQEAAPTEDLRALIRERLSPSPIDLDELIRQTDATPDEVLAVLLELELAGVCVRQAGRRVALA